MARLTTARLTTARLTTARTEVVHVAPTHGLDRIEPIAWALLCRLLVRAGSLERSLRVLDRFPVGDGGPDDGRDHDGRHDSIDMPPPSDFRGAGACLALSLARSQYLRRRGGTSTIAIGARNLGADFDAHAWLEPFDDSDHTVVHRITR